jgi:hypothetical protein
MEIDNFILEVESASITPLKSIHTPTASGRNSKSIMNNLLEFVSKVEESHSKRRSIHLNAPYSNKSNIDKIFHHYKKLN